MIYNSDHIFVATSLEDNLPNTVNESIHCRIPTISFNVGGLPDMISHKKNGYLAKYKDVKDLIEGIKWTLENLGEVKIEFEKEKVLNKIYEM